MMSTGLEPRDFRWVIAGKLAVSERIGGYGFQHRRVRRTEEISWLKGSGVTGVRPILDRNAANKHSSTTARESTAPALN